MRNIIYLLTKFHLLLLFLILEGISISALRKHYSYQDAAITSISGGISGKVNIVRSDIADYFRMKSENERLAKENADLLAQIQYNITYKKDSTLPVSSEALTFEYFPAKVVSSDITRSVNYLMLNKGAGDNIQKGQGVIVNNGVVGIITDVSKDFSLAMSVLSVKSQISVKHKKSGIIGNLKWDGLDPFTLMVENVSRTTKVAVGDTFITTGFSNFFPPDIPVAVVKKVDQDPSTSFHFIDVKLTNRLDKIDYVYIVKNEDKPQIDSLLLNAIPAP